MLVLFWNGRVLLKITFSGEVAKLHFHELTHTAICACIQLYDYHIYIHTIALPLRGFSTDNILILL